MTHRSPRLLSALLAVAVLAGGGGASFAADTHVVEIGDTLSQIAATNDVPMAELVTANEIADPDLIRVGQRLVIPGTGGKEHVVAAGEALSVIAAQYGTTVAAIVKANDLADPDYILAGQSLTVPGKAQAAAEAEPEAKNMEDQQAKEESTATNYQVQPGDSLLGIALEHGMTLSLIMELNAITDPDRLFVGQVLALEPSGWVCPVPGAIFINDWGFPRSGGRFHRGNDMFAPEGTPVLAPVAGTATQVNGTIGGLQFWLRGDDGNTYIGTHLSGFGAAGRVQAGEVLGYVGDTGNAKGAKFHLHFEIVPAGSNSATNPYPTLIQHCS